MSLTQIWYRKPAAIIALVQAVIVVVTVFGLHVSAEQTAGVVGVFLALQGVFGDAQVVSRPALDQLARSAK